MKPKTEDLLYTLLWAADTLSRPTFRNLTESFEGWAYRNGLLQQLAALEKQRLIEGQGERSVDRVHRLTEAGRHLALGGCDPAVRWKRRSDLAKRAPMSRCANCLRPSPTSAPCARCPV